MKRSHPARRERCSRLNFPLRRLAAPASFPSFVGFRARRRRAAGPGLERSLAPRPRAGRRLAGACLLVALAVGVSEPAFAQSSWLECPTTTVDEGESVTVKAVIQVGSCPGCWDGHDMSFGFWTQSGTAGTSDYTHKNDVRMNVQYDSGSADIYNAVRWDHDYATTEDTAWEGDETFTAVLTSSEPINGSRSDRCTITITDDDAPQFTAGSGTTVSNLSKSSDESPSLTFSFDAAQGFTTGSNAKGYVLTQADIGLRVGTGTPQFTVSIWSDAAGNTNPGTKLATLTNPAWQTGDWVAPFTASPALHLAANTKYWVVLDLTASHDTTSHIVWTNSDEEDAGAEAGWSIADGGRSRAMSGTTWHDRTSSMQMGIHATAVPAEATSPGAPRAPTVQTGSTTSLQVAWPAPANGGYAILDYDVRYYAGSADPAADADWIEEGETGGHTHTGTGNTATLAGLSANTAYRVQVRAQNVLGEGAWSSSDWARTVAPGAPAAPRVAAGATLGSLRVAWSPPANDTRLAITDYDVRWRALHATTWTEVDDTTASTAPQTTITGLSEGEAYDVQVRAQNGAGAGDWSASTRGTTYGAVSTVSRSLVGNLGQSGSVGNLTDKHYRIKFRTGSNAAGYTMTGAVFNLPGAAATTAILAVVFREYTTDDTVTWEPLTRPSTLVDGNNTFSIQGRHLDPDTSYQVVLSVYNQGNGQGSVALTPSASADADSLPGFSITASESVDVGASVWSPATNKLKFAIVGTANAVRPTIDLVRVVSRPTHDSDGDGTNDTYVAGDEILIDVEFRSGEAVKVDTQDDNANVALRVDVGGATKKFALDRVLDDYETLRFAYTVEAGNGAACSDAATTADCDADGIEPAPGTVSSVANTLVELSNGATVMGMDSLLAADLRHTGGFFQNGVAFLKVDGGMSAADSTAGPRATAAEIPADSDGTTLRVTFDKPLGPFDQNRVQLNLRVRASNVHSRQTEYQHPSHVARSTETEGAETRGVLTLTLGVAVRAGDRVSLGYGYHAEGGREYKELKGTGAPPKPTPAFADFPVVNNLPGAPPIPTRADIAGTSLRIMFDKALDESAAPAGNAFRVDVSDRGGDYARNRTLWGTGTSVVTGSTVWVTLDAAARRDDIGSVFYAPAANGSNRLKGAGADGDVVNSIEQFHVSQVQDTTAPKLLGKAAGVFQSRANDPLGQGKSKIMLYFDERLDRTSVPAAGNFALSSTDSKAVQDAVVASVAVEATGVVLTTSHWLKSNITYTLAYTPGTDPIMDPAGNAVAAFTEEFVDVGGGQPALRGATVAGSTLELDMVQPVDPGSVPAPSAFALWETDLETGETTLRELSNHVVSVMVNNEKVLLGLYEAVYPCAGERVFRVSYTAPPTGKLQKPGGWGADGWTANKWKGQADDYALVTNARHARCADWLAGTYMGSVILEARRAFARDRGAPEPAWFAVKASGGPVTVTGAAFAADDPKVLKLSVSREFAADETVTVSYRRPAGESGLWDVDGNQLKDVVDWPVARTETGPPEVTGVALVSEAGDDATYALGETVRVALTFSVAVDVDTSGGAPRLSLDMDPAHWGTKQAAYEGGSGTDRLTFAYTVVEPNESTQGIAVLADTLALNGGTIRSAVTETDAELSHEGLGHDPAHKVDWRLAPPPVPAPAVTGVAVVSDAGSDATYALGETIRVRVTFDEAVDVTGAPRLAIDMDPASWGTKQALYAGGSGTQSLTFAYEVVEPNESTRGIAVLANTLAPGGGTIRSAATGVDAALGHAGLGHDPAHKVDWQQAPPDTTAPAIVSAEVDRNRAKVTFDEDLAPIDASTLGMYWQVESPALTQHPSEVSVSGRLVTMKLSTPVVAGQALVVIHEPSGLKDLAGNAVPYLRVEARNVRLPTLSVADARTTEGPEAEMAFAVRLNAAMPGAVTVDYATADGTATAGEDYTAASGTLTFAAGETEKTVEVPVLDDALDEGSETFKLRLSNAVGARIADGEATGTIVNSDPLQKMWLSRFGRTVADHVTWAVSDRLSGPLAGAQVTVGGQTMNRAETQDDAFLGRTPTSIAPSLASAPPREITGRELLLGSAFHVAQEGGGGRPGLAAWGRVTVGGFDGEAPADSGNVSVDGNVTTGILGTDAEWSRLLAGVAVSVSRGEGTFDQPGVDSGSIESTMTTVSPYARVTLSERVSVFGLAGYGIGHMTIGQKANDGTGQPERTTRTGLSMQLAALGGRGALLRADESGGFDVALKADAFYVRTPSEAVSNEGDTTGVASRVRLALEGSRAFKVGDGVFTPGLELGLRHDGGDAETGTGVELGGRLAWADEGSGLSMEASVRALVAHEDAKYREWGASGAVRFAPGERGRGFAFSLAPTYGAPVSGVGRLWSARDAGGLAPEGGTFEPESRLEGELGYGMALFGDRFTGTPNLGFGLSGAGAREYRIGWRLISVVRGDPGLEVTLDATRSEPADGNGEPEHGVMLRAGIRW